MSRIMTRNNMTKYPLSGIQIKLLNPRAKVITYDQLNNIHDVNQLFKDTDQIICLILIKSKYSGHWICMFKNAQGYNFYDSYGLDVDKELDFLTPEQRHELDEKEKRLKKIFEPHTVIYNNVKMQNVGTDTCGQHVTFRLHHTYWTAQQYVDFFLINKIKDPDHYVADYVYKLMIKNNIPMI